MLLVYPPASKPCEPPAGIARLAGALSANSIEFDVVDANIEGIQWLIKGTPPGSDRWAKRAVKNLDSNMASIKNGHLFKNMSRYKKSIYEINRLLVVSHASQGIKITLSDYEDNALSPVRSQDLIHAASNFEKNPFYGYFSQRLKNILEKKGYKTIGISINYLSQALCAFSMIGFLRQHYPHVKIVIGGGLITSWMKKRHRADIFNGLVDYIITGPGEIPLLNILGVEIMEKTCFTPRYNIFNKDLYLSPGFIIPYNTSYGCYWGRCNFCPERAEGNRYLQIRPYDAIHELNAIIEDIQPCLIHFTDNALSPAMMEALIENPLPVPWYGFARIHKNLTDMDFCKGLKKSGCTMLKLGVESADQSVLDAMNKGILIDHVTKTLENLKKIGIATYVYILFGTPSESMESARKTLDFIARNHNNIDFINTAIFNLPLDSPDARGLNIKEFYRGDLSLYGDFIHPKGWGRPQIRHFIEREFKANPLIRPIIQRQPPFFTSNHAPFFTTSQGKVC
ncbi:MAG: radical SAM protein [Syntrophorhabdaceae bacterium]|nr:radical SAM protein [Syntrophorhabdaceae bacterium]